MSSPEPRRQSILDLYASIEMQKDITPDNIGAAYAKMVKEDPKLLGFLRSQISGTTGPITPRQVIDLQGDLAERLEPRPDGTPSELGAYVDRLAGIQTGMESVEQGGNPSGAFSNLLFQHVLTSRAIRIGASMNDELHLRISDEDLIAPTARFGDDLAPVRHRGFAVFEEPFRIPELRGREQIVHAISWGFAPFVRDEQIFRGWEVVLWADLSRDVDEVIEGILRHTGIRQYVDHYGRWSPVMCLSVIKGERVGDRHFHPSADQLAAVEKNGDRFNPDTYPAPRIVAALWSLLGETVSVESTRVTTSRPAAPASGIRRAVKDDVTVCVLRRPSRKTLRPCSGTKRTHRTWVEGGFTRTYWTGPNRQIAVVRTIGGYWSVGDETLPIKNRPKMDDLRR